jgi:alkaline phosphatase
MARSFVLFIFLFLSLEKIKAQTVLIHSHNDYEQPEPLTNALRNKVYSLEADVYLVNDTLKVAHDKKDLATASTLHSLYIQPIVDLFHANKNSISSDKKYSAVLMIDIKENGEAALNALLKLLSAYRSVFDRKVNSKAVQIVISGDRGAVSKWTSWPSFILFDGRMNEQYDKAQLKRVAYISDSYLNFAKQKENTDSLIGQLAIQTHRLKKILRLWAIPDNPASWSHLRKLGVDIINTDKVEECRKYFATKK